MIGARLLRSRKGIDYAALLVVVVFISLVYLLIILEHKSAEFQREVGDNQLALLNSYSQGEAMLFYVDQAAKYSAQKSVYEFIGNGGFATKEDASQLCGESVNGYVLWNKPGKYVLCAPDTPKLYENFGKIMNKNLNSYFDGYTSDYELLDKQAALNALPQNWKDCIKEGNKYWDVFIGCDSCPAQPDCSIYVTDYEGAQCKLDPCNLGCKWTGEKCIRQFIAPASLPKDNYDFLVKEDRILGVATQPALLLIFAPPKEVVAKFLGFVIGRYEIARGAMGDYAVRPSFNVEINSGLDPFRLIKSNAETMLLQECAKKPQALIAYCVNDTIINQNLGWSWQTTDQETFLFDATLEKPPLEGLEKPVLKFALDIRSVIAAPQKLFDSLNLNQEVEQSQRGGENDLRNLTLGHTETAWLYNESKWVLLAKGSAYEVVFQIPEDIFNRFKGGIFYHTHTVVTETLKDVINAAREAGLETPAIKSMLKESVKKPVPPTFPEDFDALALQLSVAVVDPSGVWLAKAKPTLTREEYIDLRNKYLGISGKEEIEKFVAELNEKGAKMTYVPFANDLVIDEYLDLLLSEH